MIKYIGCAKEVSEYLGITRRQFAYLVRWKTKHRPGSGNRILYTEEEVQIYKDLLEKQKQLKAAWEAVRRL